MLAAMRVDDNKNEREQELRSVRQLLRDWARWRRRWSVKLGYPSAVPYLDSILGTIDSYAEGEDYDERIEAVEMRAVDRAIEHHLTPDHRHAIMVWYLNEIGPAVWRSRRLTQNDVRQLCIDAEVALVPVLRRADVRL